MTAKEFLSRIKPIERRLDSAIYKVSLYESMTERVTASMSDENVGHTHNVSSQENNILCLIEARERVKALELEYQMIVNEMLELFECISNAESEKIMRYYYIKHHSVSDISKMMHISRSTVYRRHDEALEKLEHFLSLKS